MDSLTRAIALRRYAVMIATVTQYLHRPFTEVHCLVAFVTFPIVLYISSTHLHLPSCHPYRFVCVNACASPCLEYSVRLHAHMCKKDEAVHVCSSRCAITYVQLCATSHTRMPTYELQRHVYSLHVYTPVCPCTTQSDTPCTNVATTL
jgi:hypothetical protein